MSDNSFERKVRQELEPFGVAPSPNVWGQLEEQLRKRKRRERGLIWFFFGILLLGGGTWVLVKRSAQNDESPVPVITQVTKSTTSENSNASANATVNLPAGSASAIENFNQTEQGPKNQPAINSVKKTLKPGNNLKNNNGIALSKNNHIIVKEPVLIAKNTEEKPIPVRETDPQKNAATDTVKTLRVADPVITREQVEDVKDMVTADSTTLVAELKKDISSGVVGPDQAKAKKVEKPKKWELQLVVNGGWSEVTSGFLSTKNNKSYAYANIGNSGPTMPISFRHNQERSAGFGIGVELRKWFSRSFALSSGLMYQQQTTNSLVGMLSSNDLQVYNGSQNFTVDRFYLPGTVTEYRNRYHLLDIPLAVQIAWNHKKLPFVAGIGIQPGFLLGSNSLIRDTSGILFTDKRNFNLFQMGINGAIGVRLMKNSKMPVELGPQFHYRFTNVFREETGYKGHLFFFGVQAKWRLFSF